VKLVRTNIFLFIKQKRIMNGFLVIGQFEKRERPKVIADGHRDAIIDCLYKNSNTGDVRY
jgi:hypothetical protein